MRDISVGTDTPTYVHDFERAGISGIYWIGDKLVHLREPVYYLITWLTSEFSDNYSTYLLVWAAFPAIAIYIVLKRYLDNSIQYYEALLIIFLLGLYAFFVAGIRQTAAISIVLISFKYLQNAKLWKFIACIIFAAMIHNSVLVFIIAYPLRWLKIKGWYILVIILLTILSSKIKIGVVVHYSAVLFGDRFAAYGTIYQSSQNMSAFFVQLALFLICFFKIKPLLAKDKTNNILFVLVIIGLFFQSMAGMLAEMSRLSFYFSAFLIILVPRALYEFKGNMNPPLNAGFIAACLILLLFISKSNLPTYQLA